MKILFENWIIIGLIIYLIFWAMTIGAKIYVYKKHDKWCFTKVNWKNEALMLIFSFVPIFNIVFVILGAMSLKLLKEGYEELLEKGE